jgi:hypothetical protein
MKIILAFIMMCFTVSQALAQCDKKIIWQASRAEMVDEKGSVLDNKAGNIVVETDPQKITLSFQGSNEDGLEGTVKEKICDWKEDFKNGKTIYYTTVLVDGKSSNAIFTVDAKDGKILIAVDIAIMQGRKFLIYIDSYKEAR